MRRSVIAAVLLVLAAEISPVLRADVKTRERAFTKFDGATGAAAGASAVADGLTSVVVVKGDRKSSINDATGTIVDLAEQKVFRLDVRKKEYTVATFDQVRAQIAKARADALKRLPPAKPADRQRVDGPDKPLETEVDIRDTGQRQNIAGFEAREIVLTVTMHEKDRKLEESGGFVMTSDRWIGPTIVELEEIAQFDAKFTKAIYGDAPAPDEAQVSQMASTYPAIQQMAERMRTEAGKLMGSTLVSTTTFESVKSADAVNAASSQAPVTGGRGGAPGQKLGAARPPDPVQPRTTLMTATREVLSVDTSATATDVAIPAGYKEKK